MSLKDYYTILGVPPHATRKEIKQAYRKLAMQFHPDKSEAGKNANATYQEIKEAYETLMDPGRKEAYLRERWYVQSLGHKFSRQQPVTAFSLLNDVIAINRFSTLLNPFRNQKDKLKSYLEKVLSDESIQLLVESRENEINEQIKQLLLDPLRHLDAGEATIFTEKIMRIPPDNNSYNDLVKKMIRQKRKKELQKQYEPLLIIFLTLFLCLCIYLLGKR
ncbi:MAG: DnaJ domain-containing protein [Terrimonas sp.]|nr:DnaJ domain-containing protein [Terrimonas sp.]